MNYEEKYNKLVNAIKVLQEANPSDIGIRNWVNDNVPELCKSEDEKIRSFLIDFVKINDGVNISPDYAKKVLAWLEKQGEQTSFYSEQNLSNEVGNYDHSKVFQSLYNKPTSWSEEDDKLWKSIIDDTVQENQLDNKQINWLIYLKQRYTWKPSKGQMEALKNACDKSWEPDGLDPLYMLYEDLKKLKGELL